VTCLTDVFSRQFEWFLQNINTIALVEPAWLADRGI
jgi:hypothetical protein